MCQTFDVTEILGEGEGTKQALKKKLLLYGHLVTYLLYHMEVLL